MLLAIAYRTSHIRVRPCGTRRSFRNQSSKNMAFPHPQSRKHKCRDEDKPSSRGIVWNLVKRTVDVTDYRNGKDEVNPANNRTFGGIFHEFVLHLSAYRRYRKEPYSRFRDLLHSRGRRDYSRRHCELVIIVPGWPDGPPQLEEVSVEVLHAQRLARRIQYALRVVPVDGPTPCLGR